MNDEKTYPMHCLDCWGTGVVMINRNTAKAYRDADGKKRPVRCEHPPHRQVPNPPATKAQHDAFIAKLRARYGKDAPEPPAPAEPCTSCGKPAVLADGLCPECAG